MNKDEQIKQPHIFSLHRDLYTQLSKFADTTMLSWTCKHIYQDNKHLKNIHLLHEDSDRYFNDLSFRNQINSKIIFPTQLHFSIMVSEDLINERFMEQYTCQQKNDIKSQIIFNLDQNATKKYVQDNEAREWLNSFVINPNKQIGLTLIEEYLLRTEDDRKYYKLLKTKFGELIRTVELNNCSLYEREIELGHFIHVKKLKLDKVIVLHNLACLHDVRDLFIIHSSVNEIIINQSKLTTLRLVDCPHIKLAHSLNNLKSLYIDSCNQITLPRKLENFETIEIYNCSPFTGSRWSQMPPSFKNINNLVLKNCMILDIETIDSVKKVTVDNCNTQTIHSIVNCDTVLILACHRLVKLVKCETIGTLKVDDCKELRRVERIVNVNNVAFSSCKILSYLGLLRNILNLDVITCHAIKEIKSSENVTMLEAPMCHPFEGRKTKNQRKRR
jgi:hypothetical protein